MGLLFHVRFGMAPFQVFCVRIEGRQNISQEEGIHAFFNVLSILYSYMTTV